MQAATTTTTDIVAIKQAAVDLYMEARAMLPFAENVNHNALAKDIALFSARKCLEVAANLQVSIYWTVIITELLNLNA